MNYHPAYLVYSGLKNAIIGMLGGESMPRVLMTVIR